MLIEFAIEKAGTIKAKILTIRTAFSVGCSRPNNLAILGNVGSPVLKKPIAKLLAGVFIHEAFGHLSEGDNVYEDPNLQKVMVFGRDFGVANLNVSDSGLIEGVRGYIPYDDEGVAT